MTPNRPYLIRAVYEWIVDNGLTPHLLVNAESSDVEVPRQFVQDGQIIMNLGPSAVQNLTLGNEEIAFSARFSGVPMECRFPAEAVLGIYARENGRGMLFPEEPAEDQPDDEPEPPSPSGRPTLKVVK